MQIYLFASRLEPNLMAFTVDPTGANLPSNYGPWETAGTGAAVPVGPTADPVAREVARHGFFLVTGKSGAKQPPSTTH
jgi:hypothetical protein